MLRLRRRHWPLSPVLTCLFLLFFCTSPAKPIAQVHSRPANLFWHRGVGRGFANSPATRGKDLPSPEETHVSDSNSHDYAGLADDRSDRWKAAAEGNSSPSPATFGDGGHFLVQDTKQCLHFGERQDEVEGFKIDGSVHGPGSIARGGMPRNGNKSLDTIGGVRAERLWELNASRHLVSCLN